MCSSNRIWLYKVLAPAFFAAAHRAFASADNFFRAAVLMGFRAGVFLAGAEAFFGADLPFCFAHRAFCAAEILARADALIVRLPIEDFEGRPRRGLDPSRAAIAWLIRLSSAVRAETICLMSMRTSVAGRLLACEADNRRLW